MPDQVQLTEGVKVAAYRKARLIVENIHDDAIPETSFYCFDDVLAIVSAALTAYKSEVGKELTKEIVKLRDEVGFAPFGDVQRLVKENARLRSELERVHGAFERLFPVEQGYGEAQDDLEEMGFLVPVPADEAFKEEWGEDATTMYVWAWHPLATPPEGAQ
jgi:hypothetical protein